MDDDPNDMMTVDSHHAIAIGDIFAESSDNVIDFAADNDIINNEDLLLRDSAFSKFSLDSKLSTELAQMFEDEDEAPQDQDHVDANGDLQFCTFLDDTATRNMNLMMMGIGTKIVVPTKYDDVVLPEPEPIGVAQVVQHVAAAAVHQETKPQEQPQPKARVLNHGYNVIRSTKSRRRRASQPEPYRPQVDEVKASKQVFEYSSPYNHEEYQNQVKKSEEEDDVAIRKRRSCNDLDLLMDVNSGAAGGIGGQEVPLGEIEPPQKHQRGVNGRRYQRRVTVDACVSGPPSLSDLFGRRPSSTQYSRMGLMLVKSPVRLLLLLFTAFLVPQPPGELRFKNKTTWNVGDHIILMMASLVSKIFLVKHRLQQHQLVPLQLLLLAKAILPRIIHSNITNPSPN